MGNFNEDVLTAARAYISGVGADGNPAPGSGVNPTTAPYQRNSFLVASGTLGDGVASIFSDLDLAGYCSFSVHVIGTFNGSLRVQVSDNGVNWVNRAVFPVDGSGGITTIPSAGVYGAELGARYMRMFFTTYTSGSITASLVVSSAASNPFFTPALNAGTISAGTQRVVEARGATAAVTTVAGTALAATAVLAAAAPTRTGLMVQNDSTKTLAIRAGGVATISDYSLLLAPGSRWECPPAFAALAWQTIASDGAAGTGTVRVTAVS